MFKTRKKLIHELLMWLYYFVASFIAATFAFSAYERARLPVAGLAAQPLEPNIEGMIVGLWHDYYKFWFEAFLAFTALRFAVFVLLIWLKQRKPMNPK
jgi:hypothetical protein